MDRWAEALAWHNTLRDAKEEEITSSLAREWQDWYADAENHRVFDDVSRLIGDSGLYRKRRRPTRAALEADQYEPSLPIAEWRKRGALGAKHSERTSAFTWWHWLSGGLAVATVATIVAFIIRSPLRFWSVMGLSRPIIYQTTVGEIRDVRLGDGSSVTLGGLSQLSVAFSGRYRSVKLIEGQAWFKVAHDPNWPFMVFTADGTITDVGTEFVVTRDSDRVVLTVTAGMVEVSTGMPMDSRPASDLARRPISTTMRVTRGEELAFDAQGPLGSVKPADTQAATAWTRGRLVFDDQPLRYVIESVDRYSPRHIAVSSAAGRLRFSGIVFNNGVSDWLQGLTRIFPLAVDEDGSAVCVRLRDSNGRPVSSNSRCTTRATKD